MPAAIGFIAERGFAFRTPIVRGVEALSAHAGWILATLAMLGEPQVLQDWQRGVGLRWQPDRDDLRGQLHGELRRVVDPDQWEETGPHRGHQLCSDARAYFARSISKANACKFAALSFASSSSAPTDADLRAGCSSTENTCNGADASSMGTVNTCLPLPATCTATVAQYSACIVEETAFFNQSVPPLASCSTVTRADFNAVFDVTTGINQGASCAALTAACPDLVFASPI
jgi:hypothetical protein